VHTRYTDTIRATAGRLPVTFIHEGRHDGAIVTRKPEPHQMPLCSVSGQSS
jgi:hypothetical protein